MNRGDVILAVIPNVGSPGGKKRPALVVQSDLNNARLRETIIAAITSNISRIHEDHQLLINISTADGTATGLLRDSAVRCERLQSRPRLLPTNSRPSRAWFQSPPHTKSDFGSFFNNEPMAASVRSDWFLPIQGGPTALLHGRIVEQNVMPLTIAAALASWGLGRGLNV
jgi:mRNA-degrading endonuclease toxin of MazEF toxin-antitoxin module